MKYLVRFVCYLFFFILPLYGMVNCDGFTTGNMTVTSCQIDGPVMRAYANFYYSFLFVSLIAPIAGLIAVFIYIVCSMAMTELAVRTSRPLQILVSERVVELIVFKWLTR